VLKEENSSLQELSLYQNRIGDEGAKQLGVTLAKNLSLRKLILNSNKIGDEGANHLGAALERIPLYSCLTYTATELVRKEQNIWHQV
jgi:Ran GTPase-activating protein (RanGAP) involved in mRNA processing and transport